MEAALDRQHLGERVEEAELHILWQKVTPMFKWILLPIIGPGEERERYDHAQDWLVVLVDPAVALGGEPVIARAEGGHKMGEKFSGRVGGLVQNFHVAEEAPVLLEKLPDDINHRHLDIVQHQPLTEEAPLKILNFAADELADTPLEAVAH
jgi:hypothetical protein